MIVQHKLAGASLAALLVVAGVGCSGSDAAEKLTEKAIEEASGSQDVDIDADGNVKVTDEDGNTTEFGTSAELPEEWPSDLAPPDSVNILASNTTTTDGKQELYVTAESSDSVADLYDGLKAQLTEAGYEITSDTVSDTGDGGSYASLSAEGAEFTASVSLASDGSGTTSVLFNLVPVSA